MLTKYLRLYHFITLTLKNQKLRNCSITERITTIDELIIVKNKNAFSGCGRSYRIEIVDKRDVIVQLKASKLSIIELFKDLLIELKGFKYQITLAVLLSKVKSDSEVEYTPVYFNSWTKTVINSDYKFDQSFQEIIYRLENWISHGSGWIVE